MRRCPCNLPLRLLPPPNPLPPMLHLSLATLSAAVVPQPSSENATPMTTDSFEQTLDNYADLLLRVGVNLQQGQTFVIGAPGMGMIDVADFVRRLARLAWDMGAGDVQVLWGDDTITRLRLQHASEELLGTVPPWDVQRMETLSNGGAAFLLPMAPNPTALEGVDPERLAIVQRASAAALQHFSERMGQGRVAWTGAALATPAWARQLSSRNSTRLRGCRPCGTTSSMSCGSILLFRSPHGNSIWPVQRTALPISIRRTSRHCTKSWARHRADHRTA